MQRHTVVVHGRAARSEHRLRAARQQRHGLQIVNFEQLAVRLAGGLTRAVDPDTLRDAIRNVLPKVELGELDGIKTLPGVVGAVAATLRKAWQSDIDLRNRAAGHRRLGSIVSLEAAVLKSLPPGMLRPPDLVAAALERLDHTATLFGPIEFHAMTELSPVWRRLLHAVAERVPVRWIAGPRFVPDWLDRKAIDVVQTQAETPEVLAVSAATAYHEAIEAMRWARQLMASGEARPEDIAIASVSPSDYDDYLLALRTDGNFDLHFVHGVKITATREGQATAALADILIRGLTQTRMRRLNTLLREFPGPFRDLPEDWMRLLPGDAPLSSAGAWLHLIDGLGPGNWPDGKNYGPTISYIVRLLAEGAAGAEAAGERLLSGRTRLIWRKALRAGAASTLDHTLETLRRSDELDPCVSACWMPASELAASPRGFVRLLGLSSSRWPRGAAEDRLLSDHVVPTAELDPLPIAAADRRDFETVLATTKRQVVLSRPRRDEEGRLLGRSALVLQVPTEEAYLRRNGGPVHAFSETDRLFARRHEFHTRPQARAATACWFNWLRPEITPHDGVVRPQHPALQVVLDQVQSATSLSQLLRNPLGFVWRYALGWREPDSSEAPLVLDPLATGNLVHQTLHQALQILEGNGGLARATPPDIAMAVQKATAEIAAGWEPTKAIPPRVIWEKTLDDVNTLGVKALAFQDERLSDGRAYGEVPFGAASGAPTLEMPWDAEAAVPIPGTGFRIRGTIDRLDISADGRYVAVRDYKTGKTPGKDDIVLDGGRELQRCLYAFAVKAMLGNDVTVSAALFYPRGDLSLPLADPDATLLELADYLATARRALASGAAVMGRDTGTSYDDLAFALPANVEAGYRTRKEAAACARLGSATQVWEAK